MFLLNKLGKEPILFPPNESLSPVQRLKADNAIQTFLGSFILFNIAYDLYLYEYPESSKKSCLLVDQNGDFFSRLCLTSHQKLPTLFKYYLADNTLVGIKFRHAILNPNNMQDIKFRSYHIILFHFLCTLSEDKTILELFHQEYTKIFCDNHMVQPLQELLDEKYLQFL